ncbi:SDR family NAD(P)-dependent oxidoreductase [Kribbella sp.]|uniref:SDR family NAD(P)-dependent oxidoreductase n=1 Tax=Kribbella sp. TaxID=1871183 RepID=UPI002D666B03|nr:SDR family oxidoreductase [Kribbella sp.]HZX08168.1 SDR family oxidoreductase [Kribbella sp.]
MDEFEGKVAIVTGGLSGIGLAAAELLSSRGATVIPAGLPGPATAPGVVELDVTDAAACARLVDEVVRTYGKLDIVIAAAGIQRYGDVAETSAAEWNQVLDVNVTGAFNIIKPALPQLRAQGSGAIVLVSSVQAFVTQESVAAYTTSKGALNALARSIAVDEAPHGIRANTVCPGSVDTPMLRASARTFSDGTPAGEQHLIDTWGRMHPLGRVAHPTEVAEAIAFLAGPRSSFITGTALPVDGGLLAKAAVLLPH